MRCSNAPIENLSKSAWVGYIHLNSQLGLNILLDICQFFDNVTNFCLNFRSSTKQSEANVAVDDVQYTPQGQRITKIRTLLFQINAQIDESISLLMDFTDLTRSQWFIINAVHPDYGDGKPRTIPQIARARGLTRQAVSKSVEQLIEKGWLKLVDNPDHKKSKLVELTNFGKYAADVSVNRQKRRANMWGESISIEDLDKVIDVMETLLKRHDPEKIKSVCTPLGIKFDELKKMHEEVSVD